MSLQGKAIAVTGAESGIGRAVALECAKRGAAVTLIGLVEDELNNTARMIREAGGVYAKAAKADIRDEGRMREIFEVMQAEVGVHGLVANAGLALPPIPALELKVSDWERVMSTNLTGTFITVCAAARVMMAAGTKGSIVITGSSTALRPRAGASAYATSKGGLHALGKTLALELAPAIRVNVLVPGTTETPMTRATPGYLAATAEALPMKAVVQPDEIARYACFALSDEAPRLTGSLLTIDAGRTI